MEFEETRKTCDLIDVYAKQVRCLLEFAAVVWHPSLTNDDRLREREREGLFHKVM